MGKNRVKVLLCSPLGKNGTGGIARCTQQLLSYYNEIEDNSDIELHYYYPEGKTVFGGTSLLARIYYGIHNYLPLILGLKKELKNKRIDTVHFSSSASISLFKDIITLLIARRCGCKSLIHFHFGRIPSLFQVKNWEYKLLDRVIKLATTAIVIDEASYNTLISHGYKNVELLPNPLSPIVESIIESNKDVNRDARKIVFVGHVVITKGVNELVDACKDIDNIQLEMLGYCSDEMKRSLYERGGEGSEKWLQIVGEQSRETVLKEMLSAGVFVLPTYTEGFPNVIIESMACGCPIVTTPVGAIPEMLDIKNGDNFGLCVEPQNVPQLKSAIQRMLDDRKFALKCGDNARKRVTQLYLMEKNWKQLENIYKYGRTKNN